MLDDLSDLYPTLANSLKHLLEYPDEDVEDVRYLLIPITQQRLTKREVWGELFSFPRFSNKRKPGVEFRHTSRNVLKIGRKITNGVGSF